jgi:hypothetical protein
LVEVVVEVQQQVTVIMPLLEIMEVQEELQESTQHH